MNHTNIWTDAELDVLRALRAEGVTRTQIAERAAPSLPGRTPEAITGRYDKLFGARGSKPRGDGSPRTIRVDRLSFRERFAASVEAREVDAYERPKTRADCLPGGCNEARPCPWAGCKHHLYTDVNPRTGSIKINHSSKELWELGDTCALDIADRPAVWLEDERHALGAEHTLDTVAAAMGITRERARQIIHHALESLPAVLSAEELADLRAAMAAVRDSDRGDVREPVAPQLPVVRRYLPVVRAEPAPERPQLDAEGRALAATQALRLSPRTWMRRAAARSER